MIWDTAGQEEFGKLTRAYYQGAHACVVAFSTTDRVSFDEVESWIEKVEEVVKDIPMVLVQNKVDLIKNVRGRHHCFSLHVFAPQRQWPMRLSCSPTNTCAHRLLHFVCRLWCADAPFVSLSPLPRDAHHCALHFSVMVHRR
jgi:hypothetical protein